VEKAFKVGKGPFGQFLGARQFFLGHRRSGSRMAARPALLFNLPHCAEQLAPANSLTNHGAQMNDQLAVSGSNTVR
jgi:hypothetical protein